MRIALSSDGVQVYRSSTGVHCRSDAILDREMPQQLHEAVVGPLLANQATRLKVNKASDQ
jgi:hypothetical protein